MNTDYYVIDTMSAGNWSGVLCFHVEATSVTRAKQMAEIRVEKEKAIKESAIQKAIVVDSIVASPNSITDIDAARKRLGLDC